MALTMLFQKCPGSGSTKDAVPCKYLQLFQSPAHLQERSGKLHGPLCPQRDISHGAPVAEKWMIVATKEVSQGGGGVDCIRTSPKLLRAIQVPVWH